MTVCITGDVHHMSMETRDQEYMDRTEVEAAIEYAEIAAEYDVPVTLFVTGKAAVEEPDRVRTLAAMDNVEIGGHNYWGFTTPVHKGWRALAKLTDGRIGSWNGPRSFQAYEIRKTIEALEAVGAEVASWRDHAYRHDEHTAELLAEHGITHFSDVVEPEGEVRKQGALTVVPINTPPDHEHVYHAFRTPEFVEENEFEGPFGNESYSVGEWVETVQQSLSHHQTSKMVTTVLAHPACMDLADSMEVFEKLCSYTQSAGDSVQLSAITTEQ
ncbi:MAG: polysaccharide deacetylase family protein [Halorhabdus sp.]